ncbi:amidohydrolase family protein [Paenibacillus sp. CF384]|uniref:amidohydrolase family protein n=1 Tax=Paenibacillus sp. CF384 TaxID=1884382 RepID=UPI000897EB26|nr:amidohydrolase family protein [Paenibacillus sp. CF384]SDX50827.1 Cytosine/adenosine deaminase [Paenibacillus sp. CF384]
MGQWLRNVMVNEGIHHIYIDQGRITDIIPKQDLIPHFDKSWNAENLLLLPTLEDYHVHLDKQFPVDRWLSRRRTATILDQFQLEKELLTPHRADLLVRAKQTLDHMLACGTTRARVHVDIDPEIGLRQLETIVQVQELYRGLVDIEIAAFPQQGLLRSSSVPLLKQALREGATIVGCVDPAGVDRQIEACLDAVFEMSVEYGAGVDIHLHDPGHLGLYTIERIIDYTQQTSKQGKVAVSHAYCLGEIDERASEEIAYRLAEQNVMIITSVPIDSTMPRVDQLTALGVNVKLGTDHTGLDAWTPFGSPDLLARGRRLAEKYMWNDDERLRAVYPYLTSVPLKVHIGDQANFMLVQALNAEHAIAAAPQREIVAVQGKAVAGKQIDRAWQ